MSLKEVKRLLRKLQKDGKFQKSKAGSIGRPKAYKIKFLKKAII